MCVVCCVVCCVLCCVWCLMCVWCVCLGIDSRYFDDILEVPDACIVDLDDNRITL